MATEKKAGDVLATAEYRLVGKGWGDRPVDEKVYAELCVSGAFQYGNQTCVKFVWENGNHDTYDTRYMKVSEENFKEFAYGILRNRTLSSIAIETL